MTTKKVYAVVLFDQAAEELGKLVHLWLKTNDMGSYIYAKTINPNGPYFHMLIENKNPGEEIAELELQIPHAFVKAVFYSADVKRLGFV